jgi:predicted amidohydrolase
VVLANTCGKAKHGHSAVIGPDGSVVAAAENEERLLTVSIDPAKASRAEAIRREKHPVLRRFWEEGRKGLRGHLTPTEPFQPYISPEVDVRLAVAQMSCSGDVRTNVSKMAAMIVKASAGGADIVAFPELAVTGMSDEEVRRAGARELDDALARIREVARSKRICTVFGMPHTEDGKRTNAAFVVGSDGSIVTRYYQLAVDRPHLFQPGAAASSMWFRLNGVPAVVSIGNEGLWSEIAELAALAGAHVHLHIDNDPATGREASLRRLQIWANLAHLEPSPLP